MEKVWLDESYRREHINSGLEYRAIYDDCNGSPTDCAHEAYYLISAETLEEVYNLVQVQAEDEGLWCEAATATEAYLQQELRRLHEAVEVAYKFTTPQE